MEGCSAAFFHNFSIPIISNIRTNSDITFHSLEIPANSKYRHFFISPVLSVFSFSRGLILKDIVASQLDNHFKIYYSFIMKSFHNETINSGTKQSLDAASLIMEIVPGIMSYFRSEMRQRRMPGLSVPHFRALVFIYRHEDASLSQVAEHVGLKLPSISKIVDALVARELVIRRQSQEDRRQVQLRLSSNGLDELLGTKQSVETCLADILDRLAPGEQNGIITALKTLRPLFAGKKQNIAKGNMRSAVNSTGEIDGK
jgi:DNA-binding MarR family transcriptional regulator